jgi:hypothetical protein
MTHLGILPTPVPLTGDVSGTHHRQHYVPLAQSSGCSMRPIKAALTILTYETHL